MSFIDNNKSIYTINTYVENEKQNSNECCETCRRLKRKVNDLEVTVGELEKTVKGLDLRQTQLENTVKELKTKQTVPNSTETEKYFKDRIKQLLVAEKDKSGAPSKESKFTSTSKNSVVMIFHNRDFKGSGFVIHSDEVMSDNVELKSYLCVVTSKHVVCTAPGEKTERTSLCGLKVQNGDWSIGILEVVKVIPDTVADVSLLLVKKGSYHYEPLRLCGKNSMPKWRDKITVIGTSDMHSPNTVTEGVLSNMNQQVMNLQDDTPIFSSFIQCSMTIRGFLDLLAL
uniref:uncharacterized protein LOC108949620 isoform X3 n=1 Tax=Ciona intestinalis TaxID=7719 RepID=UPI00089DBD05|nr:uncharacterized protein LOC108949620 isoform X3 [Ciona intestinalis]|eukprot:XP_018668045.1 uncharacterized protein LOC108949620 isoform X3 [Ciona intestinalis]